MRTRFRLAGALTCLARGLLVWLWLPGSGIMEFVVGEVKILIEGARLEPQGCHQEESVPLGNDLCGRSF